MCSLSHRLDAEALFLKHSDFLGAVGSLAQSATASELFAEAEAEAEAEVEVVAGAAGSLLAIAVVCAVRVAAHRSPVAARRVERAGRQWCGGEAPSQVWPSELRLAATPATHRFPAARAR